MKKIKEIYKNYSIKVITTNETKANDTSLDHNKVQQQLQIYYGLKITKIVIVITNVSYLLGMFWYIMIILIEDLSEEDYSQITESRQDGQGFIPYYGL